MSEIQSLGRGLKILDMIANAERALTVTELASALAIDKSTASRLVATLVKYDYLQQENGARGYITGKRIRAISWHMLNRMPIREKAKPYLHQLVQRTGECAHTAVYSQGMALVIDDVEAAASLRVVGGIGRMIPLHCTAVGKSLLAFSDLPAPATLEAKTAYTILDHDALRDHLAVVRERGYAYDDEEHEDGVRCLAAPVYDYTGDAIAVIGISGPTVRIIPERLPALADAVMWAARELSCDLGYQR